jgi:TonB family protein
MLFEQPSRQRRSYAVPLSFAFHCVFLLIWVLHRPVPIFVTPSSVALGDSDKSYQLAYLAPAGKEEEILTHRLPDPHQPAKHKPELHRGQPAAIQPPITAPPEGEASDHNAHAGTPFGALLSGPISGHDVRPAFPVVFPDPPISRSEISSEDVQGDVVVEVTIDAQGSVIETKLLQSVGHGIDEKILTTLQNWRFHPAMIDGRPIASKHDVHFHFPA